LAALSLVPSGVLAGAGLRELGIANTSTNDTRIAELVTETLLSTETGQRGHLLTGDLTYPEPHDAVLRRLAEDFARLKAVPPLDRDWSHRVEEIERLSGPKLRLNSRASLALAIGLHELATNALN
jgi:CHASE3 domain sensor protein